MPRGERLRWPPRRARRGTRQTLATDEARPAPRQPNERDESADAQASAPRPVIEQAAADLAAGRQDTDRRGEAAANFERVHGDPNASTADAPRPTELHRPPGDTEGSA
jgi:hypothetical protein